MLSYHSFILHILILLLARDLKLIDQDCLNGGVRVEGQCICPTFVTGPYCETIGTTNLSNLKFADNIMQIFAARHFMASTPSPTHSQKKSLLVTWGLVTSYLKSYHNSFISNLISSFTYKRYAVGKTAPFLTQCKKIMK